MSRHALLAAFLVTAVIVPAGWHALDANIETDGKRLRPLQQELTIVVETSAAAEAKTVAVK